LIKNQQPQKHHRAGHEKTDQALRQRRQRGARVESVKQPPPPRARSLAYAKNKTKKRRAHQHRNGHVENQNPREREK
jgi:hypothetical protein